MHKSQPDAVLLDMGEDLSTVLAFLSQNNPTIETQKALILTGFQKDFFDPAGKLPVHVDPTFFSRVEQLVTRFRHHGQVIWVRSESDPGAAPDLDTCMTVTALLEDAPRSSNRPARSNSSSRKRKSPGAESTIDEQIAPSQDIPEVEGPDPELFLSGSAMQNCCVKGQKGSDFAIQIRHLIDPSDIQLVKHHYSAFNSTPLVLTLRSRFIDELYICGSMTNISVYATAMDAAKYGIEVTVIDDCLGYRSKDRHDLALSLLKKYMVGGAMSSERALHIMEHPELHLQDDVDDSYEDDDDVDDDVHYDYDDEQALTDDEETVDTNASYQRLHHNHETSTRSGLPDTEAALEVDDDVDDQDMPLPMALPLRLAMGSRKSPDSSHDSRLGNNARLRRLTPASVDTESSSARDDRTLPHTPQSRMQPFSRPVQAGECRGPDALLGVESTTSPDHLDSSNSSPKRSRLAGPAPLTPHSLPGDEPELNYDSPKTQTEIDSQIIPLFEEAYPSRGSSMVYNLLSDNDATLIFDQLQSELQWQRMLHQTGEVPRLICCQASIGSDRSVPIYRHPADKTILAQSWTDSVYAIKTRAEQIVGHELNHVLVQLYRDGNDFISEHSDKTLDIAADSRIINVSFGAERVMRFRTKRGAHGETRTINRVRMPHNSMLILSLETNAEYMHGINADKRRKAELSQAELAFGGERISLTFRKIATYLNEDQSMVWGQGAVGKTKSTAQAVEISGENAQNMLHAFGTENQKSSIDWSLCYGNGFNVLHLT